VELAVREWLWFCTATKSMNSHRDGKTASLCAPRWENCFTVLEDYVGNGHKDATVEELRYSSRCNDAFFNVVHEGKHIY
jgi:hypothetical protein